MGKKFLIFLLVIFLIGCQVEDLSEVEEAPQLEKAAQVEEVVPSAEQTEAPPIEEVKVVPTIGFVSVPTRVEEIEPIQVNWQIESDSPLTAVHTAIHYDTTSHANVFTTEVGPQDSGYQSLTKQYASGEFSVPGMFYASFAVPKEAEKVYLRAHTIIEGKNYWTDEVNVAIEKEAVPEEKEFVIEGDDRGLYPDTITVKKGDDVKIIFKVRSKGIYFGGLDFRSDVWGTTEKIKPGENATVEFTAEESFEFKSYWPASNVLKATGQVKVI